MNEQEALARLRFESRVFTLAKDPEYPQENQDVCGVDEPRGVAALADGVSSALFSRLWARILVEAALEGLPDPEDLEAFRGWLADRRKAWNDQIDVSRLSWYQKPKLREGAFSTLLWVRLVTPDESSAFESADASRPLRPGGGSARGWRLRALAVGDSCLFYVREGKVLARFPIQTSAEFDRAPTVLGSVDRNRDSLIQFHRLDQPCQPGDLIVLCTDALADWALRLEESGAAPYWPRYWDQGPEAWREEIVALREQGLMRYDDATLGLLRIVEAGWPSASGSLHAPAAEPSAPMPPLGPAEELASESPPVGEEPAVSQALEPISQPWFDKVVSLTEHAADRVARRLAQGLRRLAHARQVVQSRLEQYRKRWRRPDR